MSEQTLIERLRIRANIRRSITTRKSVQDGANDRISDLLEEAADEIERLESYKNCVKKIHSMIENQEITY